MSLFDSLKKLVSRSKPQESFEPEDAPPVLSLAEFAIPIASSHPGDESLRPAKTWRMGGEDPVLASVKAYGGQELQDPNQIGPNAHLIQVSIHGIPGHRYFAMRSAEDAEDVGLSIVMNTGLPCTTRRLQNGD